MKTTRLAKAASTACIFCLLALSSAAQLLPSKQWFDNQLVHGGCASYSLPVWDSLFTGWIGPGKGNYPVSPLLRYYMQTDQERDSALQNCSVFSSPVFDYEQAPCFPIGYAQHDNYLGVKDQYVSIAVSPVCTSSQKTSRTKFALCFYIGADGKESCCLKAGKRDFRLPKQSYFAHNRLAVRGCKDVWQYRFSTFKDSGFTQQIIVLDTAYLWGVDFVFKNSRRRAYSSYKPFYDEYSSGYLGRCPYSPLSLKHAGKTFNFSIDTVYNASIYVDIGIYESFIAHGALATTEWVDFHQFKPRKLDKKQKTAIKPVSSADTSMLFDRHGQLLRFRGGIPILDSRETSGDEDEKRYYRDFKLVSDSLGRAVLLTCNNKVKDYRSHIYKKNYSIRFEYSQNKIGKITTILQDIEEDEAGQNISSRTEQIEYTYSYQQGLLSEVDVVKLLGLNSGAPRYIKLKLNYSSSWPWAGKCR